MSERDRPSAERQRRAKYVELPSVDSELIPQFGLQIGRMRSAMATGVVKLLEQHDGNRDPHMLIVVPSILMRAAECALSAELLGAKGRARDLGVLLLTLMELRLDLQYMALDPSRAAQWVSHTAKNRKPWSVLKQIRAVFASDNERRSEITNYEQLSTIKHGNPAAGSGAFALAPFAEGLLVSLAREEEDLVCAYFYGVGSNLHASVVAAEGLVGPAGFSLEGTRGVCDAAHASLSRLNADHITRMVKRLVKRGPLNADPTP